MVNTKGITKKLLDIQGKVIRVQIEMLMDW